MKKTVLSVATAAALALGYVASPDRNFELGAHGSDHNIDRTDNNYDIRGIDLNALRVVKREDRAPATRASSTSSASA